jgi:hypothetical protein
LADAVLIPAYVLINPDLTIYLEREPAVVAAVGSPTSGGRL